MNFDPKTEMDRTFNLISVRREAMTVLNPKEGDALRAIKAAHDKRRTYEKRQHQLEYREKINLTRKHLIDKAGAKTKTFKHRVFGSDQFDKNAITRQAQRLVDHQHQNLMAGIDTMEIRETKQLIDRSEHRQHQREKPKRDFARATDRRKGQERRTAKSLTTRRRQTQ